MIRNILSTLLLLTIISACKKGDSIPNEFRIDGIHDIDMGATAEVKLPLTVIPTSGISEPVTITVGGLPAGITARFEPANGSGIFSSTITLGRSGQVSSGTYPIRVIGTAPSYQKSYTLNLTVSDINGWIVDSTFYQMGTVNHVFTGYSVLNVLSLDNGGGTLDATIAGEWPTIDGTYKYNLYNSAHELNDMALQFNSVGEGASYLSTGADRREAVLIISKGKYSLSFPPTEFLQMAGTAKRTISAVVYE